MSDDLITRARALLAAHAPRMQTPALKLVAELCDALETSERRLHSVGGVCRSCGQHQSSTTVVALINERDAAIHKEKP